MHKQDCVTVNPTIRGKGVWNSLWGHAVRRLETEFSVWYSLTKGTKVALEAQWIQLMAP